MIGILVGSSPIGSEKAILLNYLKQDDVYSIAADGGIQFFLDENHEPSEWIGDMDSVNPECARKVKDSFPNLLPNACSPIKDETDMAIGLDILFLKGCDKVCIFGGMGGSRPEHSYANIQLIYHYALMDKSAIIYDKTSEYYVLKDEARSYPADEKGYISVFALSDSASVSIKGLFYEYEGELKNSYALGVSNEFCGKDALIKVRKGAVLVIRTS